ncbi:hypothetical protein P8452_34555 [Trifolium repens]|nr:hypothetical protein P8452_34555 [Trifolium repens]
MSYGGVKCFRETFSHQTIKCGHSKDVTAAPILGYLMFGQEVESQVTLNLHTGKLGSVRPCWKRRCYSAHFCICHHFLLETDWSCNYYLFYQLLNQIMKHGRNKENIEYQASINKVLDNLALILPLA